MRLLSDCFLSRKRRARGSTWNCRSDPTSTAQAGLFQGQPLGFTGYQRSFLARHPLRRLVAAPPALKENRVFPAIQRRPDPVDTHGLKDVAGRAIGLRSEACAAKPWPTLVNGLEGAPPGIASSSSMKRERNTLSHPYAKGTPDDVAILVLTFGSRWSILLVPGSHIDVAQLRNWSANRRRRFGAALVAASEKRPSARRLGGRLRPIGIGRDFHSRAGNAEAEWA
jgi:hypothetical protein